MLIDPYWARFKFERPYRFARAGAQRRRRWSMAITKARSPASSTARTTSPAQSGKEIKSLDDYLATLDAIFQKAVASDAVCLKTTLAYQRTLDFANVPRERAEKAFGRPKDGAFAAGDQGFSGLHHVAAVRAVGQARAAVSDSHGPGPDSGLEPDAAGRYDRRQSADEVRAVSRRVSLGRRDGRDRHAAQKRLGRFGLAAAAFLHDGQAGLSRNGWR